MAKRKPTQVQEQESHDDDKETRTRKPVNYRFELLQADGSTQSVPLVLQHLASAVTTRDFLNQLHEDNGIGGKYQFVKVIIFA